MDFFGMDKALDAAKQVSDSTEGEIVNDGFGGNVYKPIDDGPEDFDRLVSKIRPFNPNPNQDHGLT